MTPKTKNMSNLALFGEYHYLKRMKAERPLSFSETERARKLTDEIEARKAIGTWK